MEIREATFKKRVALLPKAYEVEMSLLSSDDEAIKLRTVKKLYDDTGIGTGHMPHAVQLNIFFANR